MTLRIYAVVTPVRDELENLERLAECMRCQSILPTQWILVDNGSTDGTLALAERLASQHAWIDVTTSEASAIAEPGAPIVRAFAAGLELLREPVEVIVKLDADVSFANDHFERLLAAFGHDLSLGIAGSVCLELRGERWLEATVAAQHVRGAVRAYRWSCWETVRPLEPRLGWDTVDELKAAVAGWRTGTVRERCLPPPPRRRRARRPTVGACTSSGPRLALPRIQGLVLGPTLVATRDRRSGGARNDVGIRRGGRPAASRATQTSRFAARHAGARVSVSCRRESAKRPRARLLEVRGGSRRSRGRAR